MNRLCCDIERTFLKECFCKGGCVYNNNILTWIVLVACIAIILQIQSAVTNINTASQMYNDYE